MELKRYTFVGEYGSKWIEIQEDDGGWCRYEDAAAEIARLTARVAELEGELSSRRADDEGAVTVKGYMREWWFTNFKKHGGAHERKCGERYLPVTIFGSKGADLGVFKKIPVAATIRKEG